MRCFMKLNLDCVRAVMMYIEENQVYDIEEFSQKRELKKVSFYAIKTDEKLSQKFSEDDLEYTVIQLFLDEYVVGYRTPKDKPYIEISEIDYITPLGHEFLDNVRNDTVWNGVKKKIASVGTASLKAVSKIAGTLLMKFVENPELLSNFEL